MPVSSTAQVTGQERIRVVQGGFEVEISLAEFAQAQSLAGRKTVLHSNVGTVLIAPPQMLAGGIDLTNGTYTVMNVVPFPTDFFAVRLIYANYTGSASPIDGVAIRSSDSVGDYSNPTGSDAWVYPTFINAGALSGGNTDLVRDGAASLAAAGYPFSVPAAANDAITGTLVPNFVGTDWIAKTALVPAVEPARYLFVRTLYVNRTVGGVAQQGTSGYSGTPALNDGFDYFAGLKAGDWVTSPASTVTSPPTVGMGAQPLIGVQFLTHRGIINIGSVGDSAIAGQTTGGGIATLPNRLANKLTLKTGALFCPVNAAWGGVTSDKFWPTALGVFAFAKPQIVLIQSWTRNDPNTTLAGVGKTFARHMATVQRVRQAGGLPILLPPLPADATTMADPNKLATWQAMLQLCQGSGISPTAVLSTIGNPATGRWKASFSNDDTHPNDAAIAVIEAALEPMVRAFVGA